jgi:arsenate reductase-like glutaredoxin family protein
MGRLLAGGVRELVSLRGRHWKAQGVEIEQLSDDEVIERLLADPLSLRRPILWQGERLLLGFSAETYRQLR